MVIIQTSVKKCNNNLKYKNMPSDYTTFPADELSRLFYDAYRKFPRHVRKITDFYSGIKNCVKFLYENFQNDKCFIDEKKYFYEELCRQVENKSLNTELIRLKLILDYERAVFRMKDLLQTAVNNGYLHVADVNFTDAAYTRLFEHAKALTWDVVGVIITKAGATYVKRGANSIFLQGSKTLAQLNRERMLTGAANKAIELGSATLQNLMTDDKTTNMFYITYTTQTGSEPGLGFKIVDITSDLIRYKALMGVNFNIVCSLDELNRLGSASELTRLRNNEIRRINIELPSLIKNKIWENDDVWLVKLITIAGYASEFTGGVGFHPNPKEHYVSKWVIFRLLNETLTAAVEKKEKGEITQDELNAAYREAANEINRIFAWSPWR